VIAAINAVAIAARNIAPEANEVAGGETGDAFADRFDFAAGLVEEHCGPVTDARKADALDDDVGLADGGAARANADLAGTEIRESLLGGGENAAGCVEVVDERLHGFGLLRWYIITGNMIDKRSINNH
jgi:hypothetical protein